MLSNWCQVSGFLSFPWRVYRYITVYELISHQYSPFQYSTIHSLLTIHCNYCICLLYMEDLGKIKKSQRLKQTDRQTLALASTFAAADELLALKHFKL